VAIIKVTETDIKIIKALQIDARVNFTDLAQELGVSKNTISNRVKLLKENGIISGSLVLLNLAKFNYSCIATLGIRAIPSKVEEVLKHIRRIKGAEFSTISTGSFNLTVFLFLENTNDLKQIIDEIKATPDILSINTSIWTNLEKIITRPQNISLNKLLGAGK
jgi:DNA-binding Lrp family transcriptional regulator